MKILKNKYNIMKEIPQEAFTITTEYGTYSASKTDNMWEIRCTFYDPNIKAVYKLKNMLPSAVSQIILHIDKTQFKI